MDGCSVQKVSGVAQPFFQSGNVTFIYSLLAAVKYVVLTREGCLDNESWECSIYNLKVLLRRLKFKGTLRAWTYDDNKKE